MVHHITQKHPATQSHPQTRNPSLERSDRNESTKISYPSRSQLKTRRTTSSRSAKDSKTRLEPSVRLTRLSRRISGEIALLKEAAMQENAEVKKYHKSETEGEDEGEGDGDGNGERGQVKSDIPTLRHIESNLHRRKHNKLVQLNKELSKSVNALTREVRKKRVEEKRSRAP